jgi:hypothetical protein
MEALCVFPRQLARARRGVTLTRLGVVLLLVGSSMAQQQDQQNETALGLSAQFSKN